MREEQEDGRGSKEATDMNKNGKKARVSRMVTPPTSAFTCWC